MSRYKLFYNKVRYNAFNIMFWAPMANWCFVIAGCNDLMKSPKYISEKMTGVLVVYSLLFMRFSLGITPKNYILFSCHTSNVLVQSILLWRKLNYKAENKKLENIK